MISMYPDEVAAIAVALEYVRKMQTEITDDIGVDVTVGNLKVWDANGELIGTIENDGDAFYLVVQTEQDI